MNMYKGFNNVIFACTFLALIAGLFRDQTPFEQRPLTLWLFVAFFFLLRMKIFMDDQQYFGKTETKSPHFKIGIIIGPLSWLAWVAAAWSISNLRDCYFLVGVAIGISILTIVVVALRKGVYKEQYFWIATNTVFILLLWGLYRRNMPTNDIMTWALLGLAIALVVVNFLFSKSVPELDK